MKFNYKDKTPKIETPNTQNEIKETENSNEPKIETFNPNTEIKLDIPSFGEFEQKTVFKEEDNTKEIGKESIQETTIITSHNSENTNKYNFEPVLDIPGTSIDNHDSFDIPNKNTSEQEKSYADSPTLSFDDVSSISTNNESNTNIETPYTSFEDFNSSFKDEETNDMKDSEFSDNNQNTYKKEPILDLNDSLIDNNDGTFISSIDEEKSSVSDLKNTQDSPVENYIQDKVNKKTSSDFSDDFEEANNTSAENTNTEENNTQSLFAPTNDISLDEVFDKNSKPKKEKKEKTKKEKKPKDQTKKGFILPFGKKSKKSELLDRLDEITQDSEENKTGISDSLFSAFTETQTETTENKVSEIEPDIQKPEEHIFDNSIEDNATIQKNTNTEIENKNNQKGIPITPFTGEVPDYKPNKDYDQFEIPDVLKENEMMPIDISPLESQMPNTKISDENNTNSTTNNDSIFDPNSNNNEPFNVTEIVEESNKKTKKVKNEDGEEKSKKKIKPIIIVAILIALLAIFLIVFVLGLFSGDSDNNTTIPTPPPVTENTEIDNETVNNLVEETQDIIENATSTTEEFIENNELPPQVGIDIDDEILEETTETLPTKTFANNSISFTYPKEWSEISSFNTRETNSNVTNIVMLGLTPLDTEDTNNMRITVEETLTSVTAKDYVNQTENLMKESFTNIKMRKSAELTIAGREAPSRIYTFNDESGNSIEQFQVYVANGRDMYVITFTSSEENFMKNLNTYKEILKTIQIN